MEGGNWGGGGLEEKRSTCFIDRKARTDSLRRRHPQKVPQWADDKPINTSRRRDAILHVAADVDTAAAARVRRGRRLRRLDLLGRWPRRDPLPGHHGPRPGVRWPGLPAGPAVPRFPGLRARRELPPCLNFRWVYRRPAWIRWSCPWVVKLSGLFSLLERGAWLARRV